MKIASLCSCALAAFTLNCHAGVLVETSGLWVFPAVEETILESLNRSDLEDTPGFSLFTGYEFEGDLEGLSVGVEILWYSSEEEITEDLDRSDAKLFNKNLPRVPNREGRVGLVDGDKLVLRERYNIFNHLVQARYGHRFVDWFEAFASIGAGPAVIQQKFEVDAELTQITVDGVTLGPNTDNFEDADLDVVFAYQAEVGGKFHLTENWNVFGAFKYIGYTDATFDYANADDFNFEDLRAFALRTGIGYRF